MNRFLRMIFIFLIVFNCLIFCGNSKNSEIKSITNKQKKYVSFDCGYSSFNDNNIRDEMSKDGIQDPKNIGLLIIRDSNVTDEGFKFIAEMENLYDLYAINLELSDEALYYIKDIKNLTHLALGSKRSKITDNGMKYLANMKKLRYLDISYSQVSDEGLKYLKNANFGQIDIFGCTNITEKGIKWLRDTFKKDYGIQICKDERYDLMDYEKDKYIKK